MNALHNADWVHASADTGTSRAEAPTWMDALVAELDRRIALLIDAMREGGANPTLKHLVVTDAEVDHLLQARPAVDDAIRMGRLLDVVLVDPDAHAKSEALSRAFGLSAFELEAVLACLAPEIDRRFDRLFAYVNDDLTKPRPTIDCLLRLLAAPYEHMPLQRHFLQDSPLFRLGILMCEDRRPPRSGIFRVADGVTRFLLGYGGSDERIARLQADREVPPLARALWNARAAIAPLAAELADILRSGAEPLAPDSSDCHDDDVGGGIAADGGGIVVNLIGRHGSGRAHAIDIACRAARIGPLELDARKFKAHVGELGESIVAALRDAHLHRQVVVIHHADVFLSEPEVQHECSYAIRQWLRGFGGRVVLCSEERLPCPLWFQTAATVELQLPPLAIVEREAAWALAIARTIRCPSETAMLLAKPLAAKFRLTEGEIAIAMGQAKAPLMRTGAADEQARILHEVIGRSAAPRLHRLTDAVATRHSIDDLVLSEDRMELIDDIVRRVRHRRTVLEDWSFDDLSPRGKGLVALFHGASGTGKTMAADAVAHTLRMRMFRIDLAGVVSKYIGETEKNLRTIFDEADRMDSVLFFDEADALFGKRSEVKDAHDRYANIEINYLLQRVENFSGIAILATNKRDHLDEAFLRRIHVSIEFPMPQMPERLRLWKRSFPANAPLADDIDWDFLARRFEFAGGTIRNAALSAAYLAADIGEGGCVRETGVPKIGMREIVNAVRIEIVKAGRRMPSGEFGRYSGHLLKSGTEKGAAPDTRPEAPIVT
jgi:ATPase family associated with various cellular activities (AAA)